MVPVRCKVLSFVSFTLSSVVSVVVFPFTAAVGMGLIILDGMDGKLNRESKAWQATQSYGNNYGKQYRYYRDATIVKKADFHFEPLIKEQRQ